MPDRHTSLRFLPKAGSLGVIAVGLLLAACSSRRFNSDSQAKLVGGAYADPGEFPFVAMLNKGCGAARVAKRTYLTAGHCVVSSNHNDVLDDGSIGGALAKGSTVALQSESVNSTHKLHHRKCPSTSFVHRARAHAAQTTHPGAVSHRPRAH